MIILAAVIVLFKNVFQKKQVDPGEVQVPEYVQVDLLTPNPYSRPQKPLEEVRGIVVLCGKSMQHGQGKQELF